MADGKIDQRITIKAATRRIPCTHHAPCGSVHRKLTGWYKVTVDGKPLNLGAIFRQARDGGLVL